MKNEHEYSDVESHLQPLSGVALTMREKLRVRAALEEKVRTQSQNRPALVRSPYFFFHPMPMVALLLLVVLTTSTAAASEGALPGDLLYPIKIHVTEEVRAAIAVDPTAKAAWAIERAERRLDEAAQLDTENRLDDAARTVLARAIDTHVQAAEALVTPPAPSAVVLMAIPASEETAPAGSNAPTLSATLETETEHSIGTSEDDSGESERLIARIAFAREAKSRIIERRLALADTDNLRRDARKLDKDERDAVPVNDEKRTRSRKKGTDETPSLPDNALPMFSMSAAEPTMPAETVSEGAPALMMLAVDIGTNTVATSTPVTEATSTLDSTAKTSAATTSPAERRLRGRLIAAQEAISRRIESVERALTHAEGRYGTAPFVEIRDRLDAVKALATDQNRAADDLLDDAEDAFEELLEVFEKTQGAVHELRAKESDDTVREIDN